MAVQVTGNDLDKETFDYFLDPKVDGELLQLGGHPNKEVEVAEVCTGISLPCP